MRTVKTIVWLVDLETGFVDVLVLEVVEPDDARETYNAVKRELEPDEALVC